MMDKTEIPPSYRYAFDAQGFYVGIVKAQPHPFKEGEFLTPANSCCERPSFVEGFRPRWDGTQWSLEPNPLKKVVQSVVPESVIEAKRDEMFEHLRKNLADLLTSELRSRIDERVEEAFPLFTKLVTDSSRSFLNLVKDEKISTDQRFKNLEDQFFNRIQDLINQLEEKRNAVDILIQNVDALCVRVENERKMIEAENVAERSFFGKVVDYFRSKEPALVEPENKSSGEV